MVLTHTIKPTKYVLSLNMNVKASVLMVHDESYGHAAKGFIINE